MKVSLPIDSGEYISDSKTLSNRQCVNLYPSNPAEDGAQARGGLFSWPGTDLIDETSLNPYGRPIKADGKLYFIGIDGLYYIDEAEILTQALALTGVSSTTNMAWNGVVLVIVSKGGNGWFYNPTTDTLTAITDTVFTDFQAEADGIESVCFVDGRFVYCTKKTIFWGSLVTSNSGQTFDALATLSPFLTENVKSVKNVRGDLFAFGEEQTKVFATTGDQDLPFQEVQGATSDKGAYSNDSVIAFDSSYFLVGNGPDEGLGIYRGIGGGGVSKISTDYIDSEIKRVTDEQLFYDDIILSGFSFRGRAFLHVSLIFGTVNKRQYAYDIQSSAVRGYPVWFNLISNYEFDMIGDEIIPDVILDIPFLYITEFSDNLYTTSFRGVERFNEDKTQRGTGFNPAPVIFSAPYISNSGDPVTFSRVELIMDTGSSNNPDTSIQDTNVMVKMRYSDTNGETWVDCGEKGLGRYQQYQKRIHWDGLGLSQTDRIFEFSCTTDIPVRFVRVDLDINYTRIRN